MGWQDRDYAKGPEAARPVYSPTPGGAFRPGGWSLVSILIVINVALLLIRSMAPPSQTISTPAPVVNPLTRQVVDVQLVDTAADAPYAWGAMSTGLVLRGQIWRLFTSQYLHAGTTHLLLNMLGLYFFGGPIERTWGKKKFFVVYTLAGLAGNLLLMLIGLIGWIHPYVPAVGASGCVLGLLGMCAMLFPHAEVYVYFLFPIKIRTAAIVLGLWYAYNVLQKGANFGGDACHLAGLAFGVWYAKRGDLWWATRGSRWWRALFASSGARPTRTRSRVDAGAWRARVDREKADAELIDRLLAKVHEGGIHSLTPEERKALTDASDRQRQRDQQVGRTDRL